MAVDVFATVRAGSASRRVLSRISLQAPGWKRNSEAGNRTVKPVLLNNVGHRRKAPRRAKAAISTGGMQPAHRGALGGVPERLELVIPGLAEQQRQLSLERAAERGMPQAMQVPQGVDVPDRRAAVG